jgi:thiopurine S-methyltransferase
MSDSDQKLLVETLEGWSRRWKDGATGWHQNHVEPKLLEHFKAVEDHLGCGDGERKIRTLVPLCGKSHDLLWLGRNGNSAVGVEFSEQAVKEFFADHKLQFTSEQVGPLMRYKCSSSELNVEIYQGDFFACSSDVVGAFDAVWDRASIVAINKPDRKKYADLVLSLLKPDGAILMYTFEYNQKERDRQPYSIPEALVRELFDGCKVKNIDTIDMFKLQPEKFRDNFKFSYCWGLILFLTR